MQAFTVSAGKNFIISFERGDVCHWDTICMTDRNRNIPEISRLCRILKLKAPICQSPQLDSCYRPDKDKCSLRDMCCACCGDKVRGDASQTHEWCETLLKSACHSLTLPLMFSPQTISVTYLKFPEPRVQWEHHFHKQTQRRIQFKYIFRCSASLL